MKTLDSLIERFENAVAEHGIESVMPQDIVVGWESEMEASLPSEAITELLRVWLEYRFASRMPASPRQAIALFPNIAFSESELQNLDFEYQRLSAGPSSDDTSEFSKGRAVSELPCVGETWDDFLLLDELGEGAFARVYLARQLSMAGRLVALKLSFRATLESQLLARLHHSAIVPIYSMHHHDEVYGLCMPYLGNTTLLDLLREVLPAGTTEFGSIDSAHGVNLLEILVHRQARITTIADRAGGQETKYADSSSSANLPGTATASHQTAAEHPDVQRTSASSEQPGGDLDNANSAEIAGDVDSQEEASASIKQSRIATAKELSKLNYVGAITWIGAQLADALDHAHRHGVLHCDIKPANVLLAPDGQARLLDFNVSLERSHVSSEVRAGGTMAYMAPEHLLFVQGAAKSQIDSRSDIYSLGVVLFEMLAGMAPKQHASDEHVPVRQRLQKANPSVTPALAAIIHKCLANEPQQRYHSAAQLYDDLNAQCNNLPLIHQTEPSVVERTHKWVRRHPLLTSVSSISIVAAGLVAIAVAGFIWRGNQLERMERISRKDRVQQLLPDAIASVSAMRNFPELTGEALAKSNQVLELLRDDAGDSLDLTIADDPAALHTLVRLSKATGLDRLDEKIDDLNTSLFADNTALPSVSDAAELADRLEQLDSALQRGSPKEPSRDELLDAYLGGRYSDALELGRRLPQARASDYATWMFLGQSNLKVRDFSAARECFSVCITLRPSIEVAWFYRGIARLESKQFQPAISDFEKAIAIKPKFPAARYNMALAHEALGHTKAALDVLNIAISGGWRSVSGYAFRAKLHQQLGNQRDSQQDLAKAIACHPTSELDWVRRGTLLLPSDPEAAKRDFEQAVSLNPDSIPGRQNLAHVLAEQLAQPEASIEHLNTLVQLDAKNAERWAGRGVILARLGRLTEALRDLRYASTLDVSNPLVAYQVACGYSLVASQIGEAAAEELPPNDFPTQSQILGAAMKWYSYSVQIRPDVAEIAKTDPDLAWLRNQPVFPKSRQSSESKS